MYPIHLFLHFLLSCGIKKICFIVLNSSPGVENSNSLQCFYLENSMDREACWATVHGVPESDMTEHTRAHTHTQNAKILSTWLTFPMIAVLFPAQTS